MKDKLVEDSKTIMNELIMPNDTNPLGSLMGGYLMRWMDIAGSICAAKHAGAHVVTASVDHVSFQHPINLGSVITLVATVTRAFNTSMEIFVEVFVRDFTGGESVKSNHAYMTFVAVDKKSGKPCEIPNLIPKTSEEKKLYESASRRREVRLILSGRMKPEDATEMKSYFKDL